MAEISDTIQSTAIDGIAEVAVDGLDVKAQPIPDLIAADQYQKAQAAVASGGSAWNHGVLRTRRLSPPGGS